MSEYRYYENLENIPELENGLEFASELAEKEFRKQIAKYVAMRQLVNNLLLKMNQQLSDIAESLDPDGGVLLELIKYQDNSYYHRFPKGVFDE